MIVLSVLVPIVCSGFYKLCLRVCAQARLRLHNFYRSKKMYNNFVHVFLLVFKERLNVSYRRFVQLASEMGLQRMLGIKRIPHFTTLQKVLQRLPKVLLERMVRACRKLTNLTDIEAAVDGTGFSNSNPSHYYAKRVDGVHVKNFTKSVLLADLGSKLVLNIRTRSEHGHETLSFIPLIREVKNALKSVLADKAYDSTANREYCWMNNIENHIPVREWKNARTGYGHKHNIHGKFRRRAARLFDACKYKRRTLIESINSAIKRPFGAYVCSRRHDNQCKQTTIKVLAYNFELITRTIKIWLFIIQNTILQSQNLVNNYMQVKTSFLS